MSNENTIRQLLDGVTMTGRLPEHTEIRDSITKFSSVRERRSIEREVRLAAKRILNALDAGLADQATEHAADVGETLAAHTAAGASESTDEPWVGQWNRQYAPEPPKPRSKTADSLRSLLRSAAQGNMRAADLDGLSLRSGMTAEERTQWREAALSEARNIHRIYDQGDFIAARGLADQAAARLGADVTDPEPVDPADGIDDPRELAALLRRGGGHG